MRNRGVWADQKRVAQDECLECAHGRQHSGGKD